MVLLRQDWSRLQVPALPAAAVTRLRHLTQADFERLGNIAELEMHGGRLMNASPSERMPSDGTAMTWNGSHLRIGLTAGEIKLVAERTQELLQRPDLDQLTRR
jgi:hypothetical protein